MPRFYVFPDQASAQACVAGVDARARQIYELLDFTKDPVTGGFLSKDADGKDIPGAVTETFAIPRQRADGKWVIPTTDAAPFAANVIAALTPPVTVAQFVAQDIAASVPIEADDPSWWPLPPLPPMGA